MVTASLMDTLNWIDTQVQFFRLTVFLLAKVDDVQVQVSFNLKVQVQTFLLVFGIYEYLDVLLQCQLVNNLNQSFKTSTYNPLNLY